MPNQSRPLNSRRLIAIAWITVCGCAWISSPSPFLPTPSEVWAALQNLWTYQDLGSALVASVSLNLEAIAIAAIVSLGLAYLSTIPAMKPAVAFIGKLRFLSLIGLSFAFTLVFRSGGSLKLAVLVFAVVVFFVVGMVDVIDSIPQEQYDLARTLKMGEWQVLWEVVVLGQIDQAFVVLRQNAAMSWLMITVVESMVRSGGGIGGLLTNSNRHFDMAEVMAIQLLFLGCGIAQDYGIGALRGMCCPYADLARRRG